MFVSGEIRWFFHGKVPADVSEWFGSSGMGVDEPERVDQYLVLPGCTSSGVKLRNARFELKSNLLPPVPVRYSSRVSGFKDAWIKWSREAHDAATLRRLVVSDHDTWVGVGKRRHLRLFSLDSGSVEEIRPNSARLGKGCQVELSSIRWRDEADWWSLSFEAFGDADDVIANLDSVAGHFFTQEPPLGLEQQNSMSYPVWLLANRPDRRA